MPQVQITVTDNGASAALSVPQQNTQLVIGPAVGGVVGQPFASTSPTGIRSNFIGGPLVEAAGLTAQKGGVVVCMSTPIVTPGTATAVVATVPGGSTSVVTRTLDATNGAWFSYYVLIRCLATGTIGTGPGPQLQFSLDAGRNWGSPVNLGVATSYVLGAPFSPATIGATGIQLNFGAGAMVNGDSWQFSTRAPLSNDAGVAAALAAFAASQYGVAGVGSVHILGAGNESDLVAYESAMEANAAAFVNNRAIVSLPDAITPVAWGGTGETDAAWSTRLQSIVGGVTAPRICAIGGNYNVPAAFGNPAGGLPSYRVPLAWVLAVKRTQISPAQRAGQVSDGPYTSIVVSPSSDPSDGFVYHDERQNPSLAIARIGCATTLPKQGAGFFQGGVGLGGNASGEYLLTAFGSQIPDLPVGNVIDIACDVAFAAGIKIVNASLVCQQNGTLDPAYLARLQGSLQAALAEALLAPTPALASAVTVTVNSSANVLATGKIPITGTVTPLGYANEVDWTITLNTGTGTASGVGT